MSSVAAMSPKGAATDALARHLLDAIERVREDMEKVEFWADAMTGFSEPVPDYEAEDGKVWLPPEQATTIASSKKTSRQKTSPQKR
jgi:hypothetical protein